jgi:gas vesicle protein
VSEDARTVVAVVVGAIVGGLAGFMLFTDRGRALRRQLEPAIEDITRELGHFRGTVSKAADAANEGLKLLNDAVGERETHYQPRQTSPF